MKTRLHDFSVVASSSWLFDCARDIDECSLRSVAAAARFESGGRSGQLRWATGAGTWPARTKYDRYTCSNPEVTSGHAMPIFSRAATVSGQPIRSGSGRGAFPGGGAVACREIL